MKSLISLLLAFFCLSKTAYSQNLSTDKGRLVQYKVNPVIEKIHGISGEYRGFIGKRLSAITKGWLIPAPRANPAMIGVFLTRDRERPPDSVKWHKGAGNILPWSGEFAGKHLLSAQLVHRMNCDSELGASSDDLVRKLITTQDSDGYLGPFPKHLRLTGIDTWDLWGHYHVILGLLMYYDDTGYEPALKAACKAADLICDTYLGTEISMTNDVSSMGAAAGPGQMNYAIIHGMTILYRYTGNPQYLDMARWIENMWDRPGEPQYIRYALDGKPVVEFPAHRWESVHDWQGIMEMYFLTGDKKYSRVFSHIWWDALRGDRHNTGGWTASEAMQNNPYHQGGIETCCTVAWIAMSVDMLRLTGNPLIADELELSTLNGNIGGMHPSGRWWTYNTPMDGTKKAATDDINFQARAGSPELNCCSVNAPRGLGMIQDWAVMKTDDGFALNWYGPCTLKVPLDSGETLVIDQKTAYPNDGDITITVGLKKPLNASVKLRIPSWSDETTVMLNGKPFGNAVPGTYLELDRRWSDGDSIVLSLDMSPHYWIGERECTGKTSIYRGPILLAWDQRFNEGRVDEIPVLNANTLELVPVVVTDFPHPLSAYRVKAKDGSTVVLCDFATAGMTGTLYRSWLPVEGIALSQTGGEKPVWTMR
ncbi:beta-L-arabinofuranosidase domain-containing protein [Candidatus Latescibacterota bacterium]